MLVISSVREVPPREEVVSKGRMKAEDFTTWINVFKSWSCCCNVVVQSVCSAVCLCVDEAKRINQ